MRLRSLLRWLPFKRFRHPPPVVAVVRLSGIIGAMGPFHRGLALSTLAATLERAFKLDGVKAVALAINSPGGSAVQSALIARRIRALATEHKLPVFAFAEDVAASGGYWLATAADEIFADEASIVGSIGVISAGFGFPELLQRWGIERRVYTAGESKNGLDPFLPERADEVRHLKQLQADVHEAFRRHVRERRAGKLKAAEDDLFNGRFWSGRTALGLGLIDGLGDLRATMQQRFGDKVRLQLVGESRRWWQRRLGLPGVSARAHEVDHIVGAALAAIEERSCWSRYGL
ncbi:S49 family peptidase [Defluviicoccus vanus]|uniref:S49 family peptidase n=1 Tax=Defluviicoccus vanus TaxID=111831 RepID=A0A7H1N5C7_9PROT|nr:S49 family peptidase [Defluviicoccus vanus]QNT70913.1 S49 family peptidase [Defluviicoccus vanus]